MLNKYCEEDLNNVVSGKLFGTGGIVEFFNHNYTKKMWVKDMGDDAIVLKNNWDETEWYFLNGYNLPELRNVVNEQMA